MCAALSANGQTPTLTLRVENFQSLVSGVKQVVSAANSEASGAVEAQMRGALGVGPESGIDETRPWEIAVWVESLERRPAVSMRIPVSDENTFRDAFESKRALGMVSATKPGAAIGYSDRYANIWLEGDESSEEVVDAHNTWSSKDMDEAKRLLEFQVNLTDELRGAFKQSLGMGRTMINGAISEAPEGELSGMQPAAVMKLMGFYFDFAEMVLAGAEGLDAEIDIDDAGISVREGVRVVADSEFATFVSKPAHSIEKMVKMIDPSASAGIAVQIEENSGMKAFMKEYLQVAMSLFGGEESDSDFYTEMMAMIERALPTVLNVSYYFEDGLAFNGAYEFPEGDPDEFLRSYVDFAEGATKYEFEGEPLYSSSTVEAHTFPGLGIEGHRIRMAMNLDSPMFAASGDESKAAIQAMWGGEEITIDVAEKDDVVYFGGQGGSEQLNLDRGRDGIEPKVAIGENSVAYGRLNLTRMLSLLVGNNPAMPEEAKGIFEKMKDLEADPVEIAIQMDGAIRSETYIPLSLIEAFGNLAD